MKQRKNIATGTPWEPLFGYSRAVRLGNAIYVSGTTATDEKGGIVGKGNVYDQTIQALKNIEKALHEAGGSLKDVVRTRMFVINMTDWERIAKAHGKYFKDIRPATSIIEVKGLINSQMLIEIEADALVTTP